MHLRPVRYLTLHHRLQNYLLVQHAHMGIADDRGAWNTLGEERDRQHSGQAVGMKWKEWFLFEQLQSRCIGAKPS